MADEAAEEAGAEEAAVEEVAAEDGQRTQGNILAARLEDARGGRALDGVKVLADASVVIGGTIGALLDGVVQAGQSAAGDVAAALGVGQSGEEEGGNRGELHLEGRLGLGWLYIQEGQWPAERVDEKHEGEKSSGGGRRVVGFM